MRLDLTLDLSLSARVPVLVWGPPGVGKTATIRAWAERRKLRCWTVIASLREPADFGGLPIVDEEGVLVGAIGVSGSSVENDHKVAAAGVKVVGVSDLPEHPWRT